MAFDELQQMLDDEPQRWTAIRTARANTDALSDLVRSRLDDPEFGFATVPPGGSDDNDLDLVLFGSFARREFVKGSDLDWTLLADCRTDPQHQRTASLIGTTLHSIEWPPGVSVSGPGGTETFGTMTSGFDVVHRIGGDQDTNRNTTRRILLLLESTAVRPAGSTPEVGAYSRTVRQIVSRYVEDNLAFETPADPDHEDSGAIPRFLLNDIVRFWRTVCVDFAWKRWEQGDKKWGLRHLKLRMSRKLIFTAGLLMVYSCRSVNRGPSSQGADYQVRLRTHLLDYVQATPLEILVRELLTHGLRNELERILDAYDQFLDCLSDPTRRECLRNLTPDEAKNDDIFQASYENSREFHKALTEVFFDCPPFAKLTRRYGLF